MMVENKAGVKDERKVVSMVEKLVARKAEL
jgi:hypothetical protein